MKKATVGLSSIFCTFDQASLNTPPPLQTEHFGEEIPGSPYLNNKLPARTTWSNELLFYITKILKLCQVHSYVVTTIASNLDSP
jgi:hypothetical protein